MEQTHIELFDDLRKPTNSLATQITKPTKRSKWRILNRILCVLCALCGKYSSIPLPLRLCGLSADAACSVKRAWENLFFPFYQPDQALTPLKINTSFSKNNTSILQQSQPRASQESTEPFTKNMNNWTTASDFYFYQLYGWKLILLQTTYIIWINRNTVIIADI